MKKWLLLLSNQHEIILKLLIVCLTAIGVLWMMPHQVKYKFDYSISKPWTEKDLIAPFDFAILKNKDSLLAEKKLVLENANVFLEKDSSVKNMVLQQALNKIDEEDNAKAAELRQTITILINEIYKNGIGEELLRSISYGQAKIVNGNELRSVGNFICENDVPSQLPSIASRRGLPLAQEAIAILNPLVINDLSIDKSLTDKYKDQLLESLSETRGMVAKGEVIISKGETVTYDKFQKLESLKQITEEYSKPNKHVMYGQTMLVFLCITLLMIFLYQLRKDIFASNRRIILIFLMMLFTVFIYTRSLHIDVINMYMVPLCIMPIVIRTFFDTRLALFSYVITILMLGSVASNGFDFVFTQICAGMITIFSIKNMRKRSQVFWAVFTVYIGYFICYTGLAIIHEGSMIKVNWENSFWLLANVLLTLFAYPLIYFLERIFSVTSDISLIELADSKTHYCVS